MQKAGFYPLVYNASIGDPDVTGITATNAAIAMIPAAYCDTCKFAVYGGTAPTGATTSYERNRIVIGNIGNAATIGTPFSPTQLWMLDSKMDDGFPNTGTVLGRGAQALAVQHDGAAVSEGAGGVSAAFCVNNTSTHASYNQMNTASLCTAVFDKAF